MADQIKVIARNKKAHHDYLIEETFEAGIVLMGSEIKSIRANKISLGDGFVQVKDRELWLLNVHIATYDEAGVFGHSDPLRPRKLLMHKREIAAISARMRERGYTVVPISLYLSRGRAKIQIGLARGKKNYDKREAISKRDAERQIQRALKEY